MEGGGVKCLGAPRCPWDDYSDYFVPLKSMNMRDINKCDKIVCTLYNCERYVGFHL